LKRAGRAGTAIESAFIAAVRGDFKFNDNYPIQNYYTRVIGKDAQGAILSSHGDAYASACKM
jgi:branched-chain amino acid transport system substrate-binding protein